MINKLRPPILIYARKNIFYLFIKKEKRKFKLFNEFFRDNITNINFVVLARKDFTSLFFSLLHKTKKLLKQ